MEITNKIKRTQTETKKHRRKAFWQWQHPCWQSKVYYYNVLWVSTGKTQVRGGRNEWMRNCTVLWKMLKQLYAFLLAYYSYLTSSSWDVVHLESTFFSKHFFRKSLKFEDLQNKILTMTFYFTLLLKTNKT